MNKPNHIDAQWRIDKTTVIENFSHAASTYDGAAVLQREVAGRVLERMDAIRLEPHCILDLGAGTGFGTRALAQRFSKAKIIALDIAAPMLQVARKQGSRWRRLRGLEHYVVADADALPLADDSVDFIYSSLTLQWCQNLDKTFAECRRVLKPGGLLMFSSLGPDTLKELRASWRAVDQYEHVNAFIDMHDVGDALMRARYADPVMDVERITLTYDDAKTLMRDLKRVGAHNALHQRPHHLLGKRHLNGMLAAYEKFRHNGVLPATYEVVYGHAWVPESKALPQENKDGVTRIPLSALRR